MTSHTHAEESLTTLLGVPMRWELRNIFKNYWNPDDPRIFPPRYFGIGWDLNLYALAKRWGVIEKETKDSADL